MDVRPSLLYNTETRVNLTGREEKELNRTQYNILVQYSTIFLSKKKVPHTMGFFQKQGYGHIHICHNLQEVDVLPPYHEFK